MQENSSVDISVSYGLRALKKGMGYTWSVFEMQTQHNTVLDSYNTHLGLKSLGSLAGTSVPSRAPKSLAQDFSRTEEVHEVSSPLNCSHQKSSFVCPKEGEEFLI